MTRVLLLCTHNSARSQMAEGWVRHYANELGASIGVLSAGTEKNAGQTGGRHGDARSRDRPLRPHV